MARRPFDEWFKCWGPRKVRGPAKAVSKKRRAEIISRDGTQCFYCRRDLSDPEITIDHVVPRSKGGTAEASNLRVACQPCNSSKGNRRSWPQEWVCERRPS